MDDLITSPPVQNKNREKMMKIIIPIFAVILLTILIIVKQQNPDFALKYVILIGAVIIIVALIGFFGFNVANTIATLKEKDKKNKSLPEPADTLVLWEKAKIALTNNVYRDHIKEYVTTINHSVGKNLKSLVVEFKVVSLYRPRQICSILINANYPSRLPTVLFDPTTGDLNKAIQSMSFDPEDPADTEETTISNPVTGITSTTKKKTHAKKINPDAAEKKESLL